MITFNDLELIHEEIYPHIVVYKNLIRDVDAISDSLKFSSLVTGEEKPGILPIWGKWFGFGTYVSVSGDALSPKIPLKTSNRTNHFPIRLNNPPFNDTLEFN